MNLYVVKDVVIDKMDSPFVAYNDDSAIRTFKLILDSIPTSAYEGISLVRVACFNDDWEHCVQAGNCVPIYSAVDYRAESDLKQDNKLKKALLDATNEIARLKQLLSGSDSDLDMPNFHISEVK